jgi:hypothetical protein
MYPTNSRFKWFMAIVAFIFLGAFMVGGYSLMRLGIENAPIIAIESGAVEGIPDASGYRTYGFSPHYGFGLGRLIFGFFMFFILFKIFTFPFRMMFWKRRGWHRGRWGGHHGHHGPPWKQGSKSGPGKWVWVEEDDESSEEAEPDTND